MAAVVVVVVVLAVVVVVVGVGVVRTTYWAIPRSISSGYAQLCNPNSV